MGKGPGYHHSTKGNVMGSTECPPSTATKLNRISQLSADDPSFRFNNLMHLYSVESLSECFNSLDGKKAVGVDRVTKEQYGQNRVANLIDLVSRMKRMAYRPGPVREARIPKEGSHNATRPLGISNFEDKLVQEMTRRILDSIYEPLFLDCSYGFRPGRSCHDAIKDLHQHLYRHEVETVIDIDLANFFGTIDHKILEEFLRRKVEDKTFMRYIIRMFKAGVLADGELRLGEEGVPQGSICSPVLANVMAHHVIDLWVRDMVRPNCVGNVAMFRYADDLVICCSNKADAPRIKRALAKRLAKYRLRLNEDKTKIIPFSRKAAAQGIKQGTFDFLGFTFYIGKSRAGRPLPKLRTSRKRMRTKLKRVKEWAKTVRNSYRLMFIWKVFCTKLRGHINYYGVSFNTHCVRAFLNQATRILFKWLNRRSQKRSFTWDKFRLFMKANPLPQIRTRTSLFELAGR